MREEVGSQKRRSKFLPCYGKQLLLFLSHIQLDAVARSAVDYITPFLVEQIASSRHQLRFRP